MLSQTPIANRHQELGAKMGAFAGWDMPISYPAGTLAEHAAVRSRVGLFDVSHLGKIQITGEALGLLESTLTNHMADLKPGRARYALLCNPSGGVVDDLIAYAIDESDVLLVPNASNRDRVFEVLQCHSSANVQLALAEWTTFALQGPASKELMETMFPSTKGMPYMSLIQEDGLVIARSGYTGEWGYEVFSTYEDAARVWNQLEAAVKEAQGEVCGLAARDTLRLEMGYPLHGNDLTEDITPLEAGLDFAVKLEREFPGAGALRNPPVRKLVGLRAQGRIIPRHGCEVYQGDARVGEVTSGTLSPTLREPIAMALVTTEAAKSPHLEVDVRGKRGEFEVVDPPFVDRSPRKTPEQI
jgi:aminomethyltransferase